MKILVTISAAMAILLASQSTIAASCKYEQDSIDKFTKVRTLVTKPNRLTNMGSGFFGGFVAYVSARSEGKLSSLSIQLKLFDDQEDMPEYYELEDKIIVPAGSTLLVMMADETIVELATEREVRADTSYDPPGTKTNPSTFYATETAATIQYALNADAVLTLVAQNATNLRVHTTNSDYDIEISKKSRGDIRQAVMCLQQSQQPEDL